MEKITLITAIAGLVFGCIGSVLGIINTWRAFSHDRVRLHVVPRWVIYGSGDRAMCIEVINQSHVPVTVSQVGYKVHDKEKIFVFRPAPPGDTLPKRLEPRESVTVIAPLGTENSPFMKDVVSAFAETACDHTFIGTSPALKGFVEKARSAAR
jgi:hypothetical protein